MSGSEQESLQAVMDCMAELQVLTESLCGYLLKLDPAGTRFPAMRKTAELLGQVAMGWEAGDGLLARGAGAGPVRSDEARADGTTDYYGTWRPVEDDASCTCCEAGCDAPIDRMTGHCSSCGHPENWHG